MIFIRKFFEGLVSSKITAIIGILSLVIALYTAFFFEKKGDISVLTSQMYPVFDMRRNVGGLEITLNGESLREQKKTVWISKIKIENIGNSPIKKPDFDAEYPPTITVLGGKIIEKLNISASSEYLAKALSVHDESNIVLSPVIIEPNDSIVINFLVLGMEMESPRVSIGGKIAGIKEFKILEEDTTKTFNFFDDILHVNVWWIHIARFAFYCFAVIASTFVVLFIISIFLKVIEKLEKIGRIRRVRQIKKWDSEYLQKIIDYYIVYGPKGLISLKKYLLTKDLDGRLSEDFFLDRIPARLLRRFGITDNNFTASQAEQLLKDINTFLGELRV